MTEDLSRGKELIRGESLVGEGSGAQQRSPGSLVKTGKIAAHSSPEHGFEVCNEVRRAGGAPPVLVG